MSHASTTYARTTTSAVLDVEGSYIVINSTYLKSLSGALKALEVILGIICVGICGFNFGWTHNYLTVSVQLFFLLMQTTFMIGTFIVVFSSLISIQFSDLITKTIYEVVYNILAGLTIVIASLIVVSETHNYSGQHQYNATMASGIMGLLAGLLYFISAFIGHRHYRKSWL